VSVVPLFCFPRNNNRFPSQLECLPALGELVPNNVGMDLGFQLRKKTELRPREPFLVRVRACPAASVGYEQLPISISLGVDRRPCTDQDLQDPGLKRQIRKRSREYRRGKAGDAGKFLDRFHFVARCDLGLVPLFGRLSCGLPASGAVDQHQAGD
jgi:hypothetical protein